MKWGLSIMIKEEKVLEINNKPKVKVYAHHAFINAIIDKHVHENDDLLLDLTIENAELFQWNKIQHDSEIILTNDNFIMNNIDQQSNTECFVYRKCSDVDELIVKINHISNTKIGAILNIFISEIDVNTCAERNMNIYRLGLLHNLILTRLNNAFFVNKTIDDKVFRWFKIKVESGVVSSYVSTDGIEWVLIETQTINFVNTPLVIGFNVNNLGMGDLEKQYNDWLAMNYIQLYYNNSEEKPNVPIDYIMFPIKLFRYENVFANHFLDINYVDPQEVIELHSGMINYILWCLEHNYYVAICMDEYYIPNRSNYKKGHYMHINMIYGVNCLKEEFCLLGFSRKLEDSKASFQQIVYATSKLQGTIITYKVQESTHSINFCLDNLINSIEDFLYSRNSSKRYSNIESEQRGVYGLQILKELSSTIEGKELLVKDIRISYILYEHAELMNQRLQYLKRTLFKNDCIKKLELDCIHVQNVAESLRNLVLRQSLIGAQESRILECIDELYDVEYNFYSMLLERLKACRND